jgi:hypothetical protein
VIVAAAYKEPYIISDTGAAICSKTNFAPTGHHHPQHSPLLNACSVLDASAIFKCSLEVLLSEAVQHRQRSCSIISFASKWWPFSFIFNREDKERYGGWGTTVKLVLVKNSSVKNEVS